MTNSDIQDAARRLRDRCDPIHAEWGDPPCLRGATEVEIMQIANVLTDMDLPVPRGLLDIYRVTLGIAPIQHARSILARPVGHVGPGDGRVNSLTDISQLEDLEKEGVLWIGQNADQELIMDRSGMFGLEPVFHDDGSVTLAIPMTIEEAFPIYVARVIASLDDEYDPV